MRRELEEAVLVGNRYVREPILGNADGKQRAAIERGKERPRDWLSGRRWREEFALPGRGDLYDLLAYFDHLNCARRGMHLHSAAFRPTGLQKRASGISTHCRSSSRS